MVKVNGTSMPGWIDWSVTNNRHQEADTFRVTFAVAGMPTALGPAWWAEQLSVSVEILAGLPLDPESFTQSQLSSLIYGNVDSIKFSPTHTLLTIQGRDLTAVLIDTKTTEKFVEQTSSEIARTLALRHGLATDFIVPTDTKAGTYYTHSVDKMSDSRSEWDLLVYLAAREEYQVFVKGYQLHFEPKPDATVAVPYMLKWVPKSPDHEQAVFNGMDIDFERNLNVAKGVVVVVNSLNRKKGVTITASYPKTAAKTKAGTIGSGVQTYYYTKPDMDQQHADQFAVNMHREITRHEMRMSAVLPGDALLSADTVIKVVGTGTAFDQLYFPESVERHMSLEEGYGMSVSAKNHNPDSETQS